MSFRSASSLPGTASSDTVVVDIPDGAATGDIAIAWIFCTQPDVDTMTATDWTQLTSPPPVPAPASQRGALVWAWKRLTAADTGSYTFDLNTASAGHTAFVGLWSGRATSGDPFDFTTSTTDSTQDAAQPTALTGTATAGADIAYGVINWEGTVPNSAPGYTERVNDDQGNNLFTADSMSAGSKTAQMATVAESNWWSTLASIIESSGGGGGSDGTLAGDVATATSEAIEGTFTGDLPSLPDALAAYSFDAATGNDDSGNSHTATVAGDSIAFGDGHTGGGLSAAGSAGSYLDIPRSGLEPSSALTVMGWFIATGPQKFGYAVAVGKSRINAGDAFVIYLASAGVVAMEFTIGDPDADPLPDPVDINSTVDMRTDATWHHLAATYDGTTVTLYIDGDVAGTAAASGDLIYDTQDWSVLGASAWASEGAVATADDIRIYDTALTQDQIQSLMGIPVGAITGNGMLAGAAATATSTGIEGEFETLSNFSGDAPSATSTAIAGMFHGSTDAFFAGATATAESTAVEGSISAAVSGVMIGAVAAAMSTAIEGDFAGSTSGTLAGALATAMSAAVGGSFGTDAFFAGATATATSRAIGGTLAGHLSYAALIVGAVTGPALRRVSTGPGVRPIPAVAGAALRNVASGPDTSRTFTGPGI